MPRTLVIIEDDPLIALDLELLCQDAGWRVAEIARSLDEVKSKCGAAVPDMVVSDMDLIGPGDGVDAVNWLRQKNPDLQIVFVTGTRNEEKLERINETEPKQVFAKPLDSSKFLRLLGGMRV